MDQDVQPPPPSPLPDRQGCGTGSLDAGWLACRENLDHAPTPAVVIDLSVVRNNIAAAARIARAGAVALRPHVKTHKSLRLAAMQVASGASGLTAAKPTEAAVFLKAGAPVVTVAYPVLRRPSFDMLLSAAALGGAQVRFVVDSEASMEALASVAQQERLVLPAYMEVDTGLHRCGVQPLSPDAVSLGRRLARTPGIDFLGLLSHAGHAYAAADPTGVRMVAAREREALLALSDLLDRDGMEVRERSVGSTPTVFLNDGFDGLTEIRPGNYVFMDLVQVALGAARVSDIALQVLATVVSANPSFAIVDAGSKVLSSDMAPHGSDTLTGYGVAVALRDGSEAPMAKLSEEHGFIAQPAGRPFTVGERVRIMPNHACPVANLATCYLVVDSDGMTERWPVEAAGKVMSEP